MPLVVRGAIVMLVMRLLLRVPLRVVAVMRHKAVGVGPVGWRISGEIWRTVRGRRFCRAGFSSRLGSVDDGVILDVG